MLSSLPPPSSPLLRLFFAFFAVTPLTSPPCLHACCSLIIALVLDVGLKHCGPCMKVYPTMLKLSRQMDNVVFARMNGDENDSCMQFLRDMNMVEVPTFLFIRDGEICGRYVGSAKGELIEEILRYHGVHVTY